MQRSDGGFGNDNERNGASLSVDRRSYLKLAGVAVGSAGLFSGTASAFTRHGIRFSRTVDMVRDAGCDPTGREPCDEQIRAAADDYTLLKFPAGEYKITEKNVVLGATNVGFLGEGDVRFTVPERFNEKLLVVDGGTGLLFEGIDIDQTADGATPALHFGVDDDLRVHDVELIGQGIHPDSIPKGQPGWSPGRGAENGNPNVTDFLYPIVRSPDGTGLITELDANNHGLMGTYNAGKGRSGLWVGVANEGTLTFRDCHIEEFGSNGCYTSRTYGVVQYEGGIYRNNDNNQIRLGSTGSYIDGASLTVDADASDAPNPYEALNYRGVRVEMGHNYVPVDVEIRNCEIAIRSAPHSGGGVVAEATASEFAVENTRIGVDVDGVRGVLGKFPDGGSYPPPAKPYAATLRDVSITGTAANNEAVQLRGRPDSEIKDCCIQQTGSNRDGVLLINSNGSEVRNSTIDVTGEQVIEEDCWARTRDISSGGSCPAPNPTIGTSLPHTLSIESDGGRYSYTFSVSGDLETGATADPNDTVSGSMATGQGGDGGIDSYGFAGEILAFELDGDATAYLDGNRIDAGRYPDLHTIAIDGDGSYTGYSFSVSGDLVGESLTREDSISGSSATGAVGGGRDSYLFSGIVTDFDLDGDATVYLDGERVDPAQLRSSTLAIDGDGSRTDYTFTVSGNITGDSGLTGEDDISGSTATGAVAGGRDSYLFSGDLIDINLDGDADVFLNGEPLNALPHTLSIESNGGRYSYTFSVSGDLETGATADPNDTVSGSTATGQGGGGGIDSYDFSGEILAFELDGDATAYLNGERMNTARYSDNVLLIDGDGSYTKYSFSVSGDLEGRSLTQEDRLRRSSATGAVGGGRDSYGFSGDLVSLYVNGDATVFVNGEQVDPASYPNNALVFDGDGSYTKYSFSVSGDITRSSSLSREDSISGSSATGAVAGGRDSYGFSGAIRTLDVDGDATVFRDGRRVDPSRYPDTTLVINGNGSRTDYAFSVSGDLGGRSLTREDSITGSNATGAVGGGRDSYAFSGTIERFSLDSRARIDVDRSAGTISISGTGRYASYRLSVTGRIRPTRSLTSEDSVSGGRASGAVAGGTDTYRYTGDIVELTVDDHASVTVSH